MERLDIIKDVHGATKTTLDILNDLLIFNKLEAGVFELHKETVPVASFITKCVSLFQNQARESQIRLVVSLKQQQQQPQLSQLSPVPTSSRPLLTSSKDNEGDLEYGRQGLGSPITGDDILLVDKSKMEQVLRNLLSNAFKFSPNGSNIFVNAYFQVIILSLHLYIPLCPIYPPSPYISSLYIQELGDDTSDHDTAAIDQSIPSATFLRTTTAATMEATTTTPARRSSNFMGDFGATLYSSFLGESPPPPPPSPSLSINTFPPQGQEDAGRRGKLVLCVRDEGAGISENHQASLFQEFVQFNAAKLQAGGGSGLGTSRLMYLYNVSSHNTDISFRYPPFSGLFICKRVVELHGGTIRVYSAGEGQGSSFIVELPMFRKQKESALFVSHVPRSMNNSLTNLQQLMPSAGFASNGTINHTNQLLILSELNRKGPGSTSLLELGVEEQVNTSTLVYSTSWKKHRRSGQSSEQQPQPPPPSSQQHHQQQQQQNHHHQQQNQFL